MSDGLSQQASQPPLAGTGGASGQVPAVTGVGAINEQTSLTAVVAGPMSTGAVDQRLAQSGAAALSVGTRNAALAVPNAAGASTRSLGSRDAALTVADLGVASTSLGSRGTSLTTASTILANGYVTTASTAGAVVWTNPANVQADDSATAGWTFSEGVGSGAGATSTGTLTATNPHLGVTPTGWTRTKVEVLIHRSDTAVGLAATGDTATFTVGLQDKTGAALQTVVNDSFTTSGSNANAIVTADVTTAVAAITDTDLALTKFLLTATFARTLVAPGTRSWTVAVDSVALRVTYTRSGIT